MQKLKERIWSSVYCLSLEEIKELVKDTGSKMWRYKEESCVDSILEYLASSVHVVDYNQILQQLKEIAADEQINKDFIFNEQSKPYAENTYFYVKCYKLI